ncbi:MAG: GDP-mannose 4,6-dehydratase, partial [Candidatus Cloacimonetes bacterium]|nr:GDP-mannose 4,6-dehydratase [Candidatus Cloacimonadota bacterium]
MMEQTRTYLVTGGAGFIGSHLCDALLKQKAQVLCVDNLCDFYDPEIKLANLRSLLPQPGFHFLRADIRD